MKTGLFKILILISLATIAADRIGRSRSGEPQLVDRVEISLLATTETELAPHGEGNVYAPAVIVEDSGLYRVWYGGQGRDGRDRIHYAESRDGNAWKKFGVVLEDKTANHVNDPSVVKFRDQLYMYYTRAESDVVDEIDVATSVDGISWAKRGAALEPGARGSWDSLLVGRPSVIVENGRLTMWYDGRKDLPPGAPAKNVPKSADSHRAVGRATSTDGIRWIKEPAGAVLGGDIGGVDVNRFGDRYLMVYERHDGIGAATSTDGIGWIDRGILIARSGTAIDRHGEVTPFLLAPRADRGFELFAGAARAETWDRNAIVRIKIDRARIDALFHREESIK